MFSFGEFTAQAVWFARHWICMLGLSGIGLQLKEAFPLISIPDRG